MNIKLLALVLSAICFRVTLLGADYYVKNGGNDTLDGHSDINAWATLAKVSALTLGPGDHVMLKCGSTWNEQLTLNGSGTSGNIILVNSYGSGAKPLIVRNSQSADTCILASNNSYIFIQNLALSNAKNGIYAVSAGGTNHGFTIDNCAFSQMNWYTPGPSLDFSTAIHFPGGGTWYDTTVTNCTFDYCCNGLLIYTTTYNLFTANCWQRNGVSAGISLSWVMSGVVDNWLVSSCGGTTPVWFGPTGMYFQNCSNLTISNSVIWDIRHNGGGDGDGIDIDHSNSHLTITQCKIFNNQGPGIVFLGTPGQNNTDITVKNCMFWNNECLARSLPMNYDFNCIDSGDTGTFESNGDYTNTISDGVFSPNFGGFTQTGQPCYGNYQPGWEPIFGYRTAVSAGGFGAVASMSESGGTHQIWQFSGSYTGGTAVWQPITNPGNMITAVSIGSDGALVGLDDGRLGSVCPWRYNGGGVWVQSPGGFLKNMEIANNSSIWCVNTADWNMRWDTGINNWAVVTTTGMVQVSPCAMAPYAWGVAANLGIYKFNGSSWIQVPGGLTQISAYDQNHAVGLNGNSMWITSDGGATWSNIPGDMKQVSYSKDGVQIWAIAADNTVWYRWTP